MRVCGFMGIVLDEPATDPDSDDLFYTVMHVMDPDASPGFTKPSAQSVMLLIPRRPGGHPYLVVSHLPTPAAVETVQRWARKDSTLMLVSPD